MNRYPRRLVRRWVLRPLLTTAAVLYFLIDALVLGALRPVARWIGRLRVFERIAAQVRRLGPYPMLVLFLAPLVVLEPAKPVGFYLMGTGHALAGATMIGVAELLKITLVERLFHIGRDKMLTIRWFAWVYGQVIRVIDWLKALPPVPAVLRAAHRVTGVVRGWARRVRAWVWRIAQSVSARRVANRR